MNCLRVTKPDIRTLGGSCRGQRYSKADKPEPASLSLATGLTATGLRQQVDSVDNRARILLLLAFASQLSLRDLLPEASCERSEAGSPFSSPRQNIAPRLGEHILAALKKPAQLGGFRWTKLFDAHGHTPHAGGFDAVRVAFHNLSV